MNIELNWAAPIVPGKSMMGLPLGLSRQEVLAELYAHKVASDEAAGDTIIQFRNSPKFVLDPSADGIVMRDLVSRASHSKKLIEMFVMGLRDEVLTHLMSSLVYGATLEYYKGKIFEEVGFGDLVVKIAKYCELHFDSGDELFYPINEQYQGMSIGGSCSSLDEDPDQTISYIRVYKPRK